MAKSNPYLPEPPAGSETGTGAPQLANPILGFGLMIGRCNPIFRNCLLFNLGKGGMPVCPPPTFIMTRMVATALRQYPEDYQRSFMVALGEQPDGGAPAEGGTRSAAKARESEEARQFLSETEEYAQAFEVLGKETHGQASPALLSMLALMQEHPGLKITLSY